MTLFRNVVFIAALAGLCAGIVLAALQSFATVPLILQAETFENAGEAAPHDHGTPAAGEQAVAPHSHDHDEEGWAPADGFERFFFTAAANALSGIGFGLVLLAVSELSGGISSWRNGLFWGFAGFAVFTLAPGLGLPPELPAMPAADLVARQVWWVGTVIATAAGLWLIAFRKSLPLAALGVALIVLPHVIGAPQPESHESPVPADLHHSFVVAVTITNLVFWLVLGAVAGMIRSRFLGQPALRGSFA
ncbi:CbtA family protein [Oryzicola mucosus]|uniref:CbtA family protein n=1 Tax=Oryzicola mucosus TaxID=2767425 RepID=A0A8J6PVM3_9HYPH|nr:CbtA family protein [Oryzicola mucosus]MBD0414848.1 CbtA family protein [Oryzicola mucosus]